MSKWSNPVYTPDSSIVDERPAAAKNPQLFARGETCCVPPEEEEGDTVRSSDSVRSSTQTDCSTRSSYDSNASSSASASASYDELEDLRDRIGSLADDIASMNADFNTQFSDIRRKMKDIDVLGVVSRQQIAINRLQEENQKMREQLQQLTELVKQLSPALPKPAVPQPAPKPVVPAADPVPKPAPVPTEVTLRDSDLCVAEDGPKLTLEDVKQGKFPYVGGNPNPYALLDDQAFEEFMKMTKQDYVKLERNQRMRARIRMYERINNYLQK